VVQLTRTSGNHPGRLAHLAPRLAGAGGVRGWWSRPVSPGLLLAGSSAGVVVAALGLAAFVLGGTRAAVPTPQVTPAVDAYWLQHSYDIGQVPAAGSGQAGYSPPASVGTRTGHRVEHPGHAPAGPAVLPQASVSASPSPSRAPSGRRGAAGRRV